MCIRDRSLRGGSQTTNYLASLEYRSLEGIIPVSYTHLDVYKRQHLNIYGVRIVAGLVVDALMEEVPALAKYVRRYDYVAVSYTHLDVYKRQQSWSMVSPK